MKKAKSKKTSSGRPGAGSAQIPYQKPAIRSPAFAKASMDAKAYAADRKSLRELFDEASTKAAAIPKEPFKDSWPYLQAMLRLIRAYSIGQYCDVPRDALLSIIAGLSYLVDPFDLIPDEIPFLGYLDDATVIAFAVSKTRSTLDDFMTWETTGA